MSAAPTRRALLGAAARPRRGARRPTPRTGAPTPRSSRSCWRSRARLAGAYEAALRRDAIDAGLGELLLEQEREHIRGARAVAARRSAGARRGPPCRRASSARRSAAAPPSRASRSTSRPRRSPPTRRRRPRSAGPACAARSARSWPARPAHEVALRAAAGLPLLAGGRRTRVASMGMGFITAPGPLELLVILVVALLVLGPEAAARGRPLRRPRDARAEGLARRRQRRRRRGRARPRRERAERAA